MELELDMGESSTPSPSPMNSPGQSNKILDPDLLMDHIREYMLAVKQTLADEPDKLRAFLTLLRRYNDREIPPRALCIHLTRLLRKHLGLLLLINNYLPVGCEFELKKEGFVYSEEGYEPMIIMRPPRRVVPKPAQDPVQPMETGNPQ